MADRALKKTHKRHLSASPMFGVPGIELSLCELRGLREDDLLACFHHGS
jgi:hypothetical protein